MENPEKTPVPANPPPEQIHLKRRAWVTSPELWVMGVDPGLGMTGVAVLRQVQGKKPTVMELAVVATEKAEKKARHNLRVATDDKRRFTEIWGKLSGIAEKYPLDAIAVEVYSPWQRKCKGKAAGGGFATAWKTATVYGLGLGFGFSRGLLVFPFLPMDLKKGIVGKKGASKEDVKQALFEKVAFLGEHLNTLAKSKHEHVTDAVAHAYLGICEMHTMRQMLGVTL